MQEKITITTLIKEDIDKINETQQLQWMLVKSAAKFAAIGTVIMLFIRPQFQTIFLFPLLWFLFSIISLAECVKLILMKRNGKKVIGIGTIKIVRRVESSQYGRGGDFLTIVLDKKRHVDLSMNYHLPKLASFKPGDRIYIELTDSGSFPLKIEGHKSLNKKRNKKKNRG